MKLSLSESETEKIISDLAASNTKYNQRYPGDSSSRQPVHTVYGGANLYSAASPQKLGKLALRGLNTYAPDFASFAKVLGLKGSESLPTTAAETRELGQAIEANEAGYKKTYPASWLAYTIYKRVLEKLEREPVEDNRIDFEDGYGNRPDDEEDKDAIRSSEELAKSMKEGSTPPFIGIRIKSFTEECRGRSMRTLDLFLTHLDEITGGKLPNNFVITLPKVTHTEQVTALVKLLEVMEKQTNFPSHSLKLELMIETTQSIINHKGESLIPQLIAAGEGRCISIIFGTYDYTACCNITAAHQTHTHSAADLARHFMQIVAAGTGVNICDGATTIMPVGPHRAPQDGQLTVQQIEENQRVIHSAWKLHFDNVSHSLQHAYYQGWDLNPAQLPIRYAAVYNFFLVGLENASDRLIAFLNKAAQATLVGNTFDDAATGQGLLNFYLRGLACGAITESEALATGITLDELKSRSFVKIVADRAKK